MDKNLIIIITVIIIIHYLFLNVYEKCIFQLLPLNTNRPSTYCKNKTNIGCQGMPSGHVEIATIIVLLLFNKGLLNFYIAISIIIFVGLQRIIWKRHNFVQIIFGLIIGYLYVTLYLFMKTPFKIIMTIIVIFITLIILIFVIIENKIYKTIPEWVDKDLYYIIDKKRNTPFYLKIIVISSIVFVQNYSLFWSWNLLENKLDQLISLLNYQKYDIVIGIKSGGAIISNYISKKLNLPNYYIKVGSKCNKNSIDSINEFFIKSYSQLNKMICEDINVDIKDLRVLLIDEDVDSGITMITARNHLLNIKKAKKVTMACISNSSNIEDLISTNDTKYFVWPWGYDN